MALVRPVSSVPTDERAAVVSEVLDRVASVASMTRLVNEVERGEAVSVLMAPVYV